MKKHSVIAMALFLMFSFPTTNVLAFDAGTANSSPTYVSNMDIQVDQVGSNAKKPCFYVKKNGKFKNKCIR